MWPAHFEQFSTFQTTMSKGDREVLNITDVKAIQQKINSNPREKAKHSTAEDKAARTIKNGAVGEANSAIIYLAAFNAKVSISAIQQVKNAEQALNTTETSTQGLTRCLCKARQSLKDAWADTQIVSFCQHCGQTCGHCNGRRGSQGSAHWPPNPQALKVGTGAHGHSLDVLTKDIPITSYTIFGGNLGKAVAKVTTASRYYKALGDCFVVSGLSRPRPARGLK